MRVVQAQILDTDGVKSDPRRVQLEYNDSVEIIVHLVTLTEK